ncbi:MAG TPA: ABC transporter permease [Blastocatellia bacterium]|nr:ABC transporter permease [Blastocatellia bacterium]
MIADFSQDVRYGARMLTKNSGFTLVAGLSLALGIGLTTAIFSLAYSILLHALPYPNSERLVTLWLTNTAAAAANVSRFNANAANWMDWRAQSEMFEDIALTRPAANFNLTGNGPPERVQGGRTTWNLPQVLGVEPLLGRMLTEEEAGRDAKVAVLTYGFWQRRFGSDPAIVGQSIQLSGATFEVIGVMPPGFRYPTKDFDLWTPLFIPPNEVRSQYSFNYRSIGRLKPGVTLEQTQAETSEITRRWAQQYPAGNNAGEYGVLVESLLDTTVGKFRTTLQVLLAAVGCLLLIGCINLGGLLTVRASARTQEFAIRAALGASAARLRRQTLAEVLPLSVAGGAGGVLLAWLLLKVLVPLLPPQLPGLETIGLHWPVLAFALALSVLVVLVAGMLPARLASRVQLAGTIQQDSRTVAGGGAIRNALVSAQIAVTLVLVFAGGLLVRSLVAVTKVNPGFSTQGVLTMHLAVTRAKYPTDLQVADYYRRLVARVETIPGVTDAGMVNMLPFSELRTVYPVEFEPRLDDSRFSGDGRSVTPGYFAAMGIPLIRGRDFSEHDKEGAPLVGIIDEQLALKAFGNVDPLGKRFRFGVMNASTPWLEIVGVVGHIRNDSLETDPRPQMYWPEMQQTSEANRSYKDRAALVVRTDGRPESFVAAVVEQIHGENPDQPVYDVRSMEDWLDRSLQPRNLMTGLVTLFGGASLLLACLGLYGVLSYGTGLRLREFAIRTALGAQPGDVRRLVLTHAGRLWLWGSAIGLVAAWPAGRALRSQLYGVGSTDVVALVVALSLLLVTALVAGLGPARRAARVDPAVTLRGASE